MTGISIPASIYSSIEKYDQSTAAKLRQMQNITTARAKRNTLGRPDYLIDIPEQQCAVFNNAAQSRAIGGLIDSVASDRFVALTDHGDPLYSSIQEFIWNKLSHNAKDYLNYTYLGPGNINTIPDLNLKSQTLKGCIYVYKKIWVGMYFADIKSIDTSPVLINYALMFKVGTKASNLSNMDMILDFASSIGYGTEHPIDFKLVTSTSGDTFYKAELVLNKGFVSPTLDDTNLDLSSYMPNNQFKATKHILHHSKYESFWVDLLPFSDNLSIKLMARIKDYMYCFPSWYSLLTANFKPSKADFYPTVYQEYIDQEIQPDARKFIRFVQLSLENSLARYLDYRLNLCDTPFLATIYDWHTDRIKSFIQKIDTPRFRSLVHSALSSAYSLEDSDLFYLSLSRLQYPSEALMHIFDLVEGMYFVHSIWPDSPISSLYSTLDDAKSYVLALTSTFQTNFNYSDLGRTANCLPLLQSKLGREIKFNNKNHYLFNINAATTVTEWLYDNISPVAFINWVKASVEDTIREHQETSPRKTIVTYQNTSRIRYGYNSTIKDLLNMICQYQEIPAFEDFECSKKVSLYKLEQALLEFGFENAPSNKSELILPMDLFPVPVEVQAPGFDYGKGAYPCEKTWKFLQPKTTRHLEIWGNQVGNCVGNTSTYYRNMQKNKAIIILACIDNRPRITIYAVLEDQKLNFGQVKDRLNRSLQSGEVDMLNQALSLALSKLATT